MAGFSLLFCVGLTGIVAATGQSSSTNYSVNDVQIGGNGSATNDCSTNYCSQATIGDTVAGSASSTNYSAKFGDDTTDTPLLEVIVEGSNTYLGTLDPGTTYTATHVIKVRSYLSDGYALYISGSAPSQGEHTLKAMSTGCPCTSDPGTEQFGINLAYNTSPSVGAAAIQVPSGQFSFGAVTQNYATSNQFMYNNGDEVASSTTSTGETDYTLSLIVNISNATPAGHYSDSLSAIVVPAY